MNQAEGTKQLFQEGSVELLQTILETGQNRSLPLDDVREIAYDLVTFFELLAEGNDE